MTKAAFNLDRLPTPTEADAIRAAIHVKRRRPHVRCPDGSPGACQSRCRKGVQRRIHSSNGVTTKAASTSITAT